MYFNESMPNTRCLNYRTNNISMSREYFICSKYGIEINYRGRIDSESVSRHKI